VKQRIVLLGPPASGKGTQADLLSSAYGIPHVSTGALLRSECSKGTDLGREADAFTRRGLLVPDELAVRIVTAWISEHGPRFLLDGFPRTVGQAESLSTSLQALQAPLDLVVVLELGEEEIRRRIGERLSCLACGATYSKGLHGCTEGIPCPRCGTALVKRNDDTSEALSERLRIYRESTAPVIGFYESREPGIFHRIPAAGGSEEVFASLSHLVSRSPHSAS